MWAMIGTCIALALWTTGLLYLTRRSEKKRRTAVITHSLDEKKNIANASNDIEV
jgi:ACS family pantothenate transporter-like MFS transporter